MHRAQGLLVAYVVAAPLVVWALRDVMRFPGRLWYWTAQRRSAWLTGLFAGYVVAGVPGAIVALMWWRSAAREMLTDELIELRAHYREHRSAGR